MFQKKLHALDKKSFYGKKIIFYNNQSTVPLGRNSWEVIFFLQLFHKATESP